MGAACGSSGNSEPAPNPNPGPSGGEENSVTDVITVKSNLMVDLSTDKACYAPGSVVK